MTKPAVLRVSGAARDRTKERIYLYDSWVLLASFDELVVSQFGVFISVHVPEDFVHALRWF